MDGFLSVNEAKTAAVVSNVLEGKMELEEACERLGIHRSTLWRRAKRYEAEGLVGMAHRLRGREGNRSANEFVREAVLTLFRDEYGPHGYRVKHFFEDAREAGEFPVKVSYPSVVRWLREEGLVQKAHKGRKHRSRRPRKPAFGEMLQMDTSIHDWMGTGQKFALISTMDDATSRLCGATMTTGDTTLGNLAVMKRAFTDYGLPLSIYVDR